MNNGLQWNGKVFVKQYNAFSPFERIASEVSGPFAMTESENKYMMVVILQSVWESTPFQIMRFISRLGVPLESHSDQGRNV